MTNPTPKWTGSGPTSEVRTRKSVRLLLVGDKCPAGEQEQYFSDLRECADMCRHLYDVKCNFTSSGKEAIELMRSWEPTVILVDAHLNDLSSLEIIRHARDEHLPVVVTSDFPSQEIENSVRDQGAAAYVTKSENPDDLEVVLQRIVHIATEARIKH